MAATPSPPPLLVVVVVLLVAVVVIVVVVVVAVVVVFFQLTPADASLNPNANAVRSNNNASELDILGHFKTIRKTS